jgi:aryl-alcohol dehydrogenase-like predicted oxidoreductase
MTARCNPRTSSISDWDIDAGLTYIDTSDCYGPHVANQVIER